MVTAVAEAAAVKANVPKVVAMAVAVAATAALRVTTIAMVNSNLLAHTARAPLKAAVAVPVWGNQQVLPMSHAQIVRLQDNPIPCAPVSI